MECAVTPIVSNFGKCRVPAVMVIGIHPAARRIDEDLSFNAHECIVREIYKMPLDWPGRYDIDYRTSGWYSRHNLTSLDDMDVVSWFDHRVKWREGETVVVPDWDSDPRNECAPGIHCFRSRAKAEMYHF